jgi:hypothetical protein
MPMARASRTFFGLAEDNLEQSEAIKSCLVKKPILKKDCARGLTKEKRGNEKAVALLN